MTLSRPCQAAKERPPRSAEPPLAQAASGPAPGILVDVGGHKLHIRCLGPAGTGPTVILEAGGGGYSNGWSLVQDLLSPRVRSCAYDNAEEAMNFYVSIFKNSKIPSVLLKMLADKDAVKSKRVMEAMLQMSKIDIKKLKQAYEQR